MMTVFVEIKRRLGPPKTRGPQTEALLTQAADRPRALCNPGQARHLLISATQKYTIGWPQAAQVKQVRWGISPPAVQHK